MTAFVPIRKTAYADGIVCIAAKELRNPQGEVIPEGTLVEITEFNLGDGFSVKSGSTIVKGAGVDCISIQKPFWLSTEKLLTRVVTNREIRFKGDVIPTGTKCIVFENDIMQGLGIIDPETGAIARGVNL